MTDEATDNQPGPAATRDVRDLCEVNVYALAKTVAALLAKSKDDRALRAVLKDRYATAIIDRSVYDGLLGLLETAARTHTFTLDCNPLVEPDCPDMMFER